MTGEEAIEILKSVRIWTTRDDVEEALDMAIKALEQEPILDKIRAEIEQLTITEGGDDYVRKMAELFSLKMKVLQIIDKYKAENPTGSEIDKVDCENTKCENCNNHGCCDYESGRK